MSRFYRVSYAIFAWFVRIYFRLKTVGAENMPESGAVLVCANHSSAADPVAVCASVKRQVCYMAKKEVLKIPLLSWFLKNLGAYPVDRSRNDVGALKHTVELLSEGKAVGIFPQGTRYRGVDPRSTEVKSGAGLIVARTQCDVLPVYIKRKNNRNRIFRRTYVIIGKPIKYEEFNYRHGENGEYTRISNMIFDRVCRLGEEFDK